MQVLENKSGSFTVDDQGVLQNISFLFSGNCFRKLQIPYFENEKFGQMVVGTLHIPEGVVVIPDNSFCDMAVLFEFSLPKSLKIIGDHGFVHGFFPEVVIPENIEKLGNYAFGGSVIRELKLDPGLRSEYGRHFKDATIGTLMISEKFRGEADHWNKEGTIICPGMKEYGYLASLKANVSRIEHIQWF